MTESPAPALLEVENLTKYFPIKGGLLRRVVAHLKAVDGVSFRLAPGETFGLVGESGCGKSTLGRAILRLQEPTSGRVVLDGTDITALARHELVPIRRRMQIIFQDPFGSLNPRRTVAETLREPLDAHRIGEPQERRARVTELLDVVGLRPEVLNRYPHEFSGGQRQRIGIARALALSPQLVVADEPVSALDVSVQSQVLNLLADIQREFGLSLLFISHDLAVVQHVADTIGVMYLGRIVETAAAADLYQAAKHPYTQALLSAAPRPDPLNKSQRTILPGDVPSAADPPGGCPFHTRCPEVMPICRDVVPPTVDMGDTGRPHWVTCHLYGDASSRTLQADTAIATPAP